MLSGDDVSTSCSSVWLTVAEFSEGEVLESASDAVPYSGKLAAKYSARTGSLSRSAVVKPCTKVEGSLRLLALLENDPTNGRTFCLLERLRRERSLLPPIDAVLDAMINCQIENMMGNYENRRVYLCMLFEMVAFSSFFVRFSRNGQSARRY